MRKTAAVLIASAACFVSSAAHAQAAAQEFGEPGQIMIGIDRLMPFINYENVKLSVNNTSGSATVTSLSFIGHGHTVTFYNQPRFAIDYVVTSHLTIGGSVYFYSQISSSVSGTNANGVSQSVDEPKETLFGIAPRVGYVIPLGSLVAFWPRGGFSFNDANHTSATVGTTTVSSGSATQFALDLEPTFVFVPIPHVAFTLIGAVDIPLTGSVDVPAGGNLTVNEDLAEFHFGVHGGLLVYF